MARFLLGVSYCVVLVLALDNNQRTFVKNSVFGFEIVIMLIISKLSKILA